MLNITSAHNEHTESVPSGQKKKGPGIFATKLIVEIILVLIIIIAVIPLIWVVFLSLKSNSDIFLNPLALPNPVQWINYQTALAKIPFGTMLKNTGLEMLIAIPACLVFSVLSSFAIARVTIGNGKINNILFTYYVSGIVIPGFILMFPLYVIMNKLHLYDTIWSMGLTHIAWSAPMNTMIMVGMLKSVPSSLEEAAAIDGSSIWDILFKIYVPLIKPTMITLLILMFLDCWNDFALAKVLLLSNENRTISLATSLFKGNYSTDYATMTAGVVILVAPELAVFSVLQKYIIDGIMEGAVKG